MLALGLVSQAWAEVWVSFWNVKHLLCYMDDWARIYIEIIHLLVSFKPLENQFSVVASLSLSLTHTHTHTHTRPISYNFIKKP